MINAELFLTLILNVGGLRSDWVLLIRSTLQYNKIKTRQNLLAVLNKNIQMRRNIMILYYHIIT